MFTKHLTSQFGHTSKIKLFFKKQSLCIKQFTCANFSDLIITLYIRHYNYPRLTDEKTDIKQYRCLW